MGEGGSARDRPSRPLAAEDGSARGRPGRSLGAETIVVHKGHGLPYSKGLMAQSLSATGLAPERSFELARLVEARLGERGQEEIDVEGLSAVCEQVLAAEEGEAALRRFRGWRRLDRLDRPLVVFIGGTTGVGKSTLATMLAARLGINRVIATDVIRQVLRAFFTPEAMPTVHHSAFDVGGLEGFADQAERVAIGVEAIVERAVNEATPLVVEGVHLLPGTLVEMLGSGCVPVEALLVVEDEERHRGHFSHRPGTRPAERYLAAFDEIRLLQDHLAQRARGAGVAVIDNANVDVALARLMQQVLHAVAEAT